ncbi:MAG: S46 family peptidase [Bacteroidales bacterium]|nr:S46 family peptidase [Bacteroidales bacterium]
MKKNILLLLVVGLLSTTFASKAKADEGMWLPFLIKRLNYVDMQKEGLKLTAEEIYSANHSSLKDAIIQLGNGCTGEIISNEGLILTNHHCGFGSIQSHSTVEHDYLTDGFWAMNKQDELPNPGFFVKFLVRIDDVTTKVLANVNDDMTEEERSLEISKIIRVLRDSNSVSGKYDVVIKPFFNGNEYYMFIMQTYNDVRLVGAPPSSIGKYGGDTDNWMWPRHTGDFSMFRVYTAPDGSPAKYSKDNIPMKPKHFLPVSVDGVKENDFAMIMGYPGSTDRYLTSYGVHHNLNLVYPTRIKIRRAKLDIYSEDMKADPKVRIQYASKYARVANYWKNFIGMSKGLRKLKVAEKKEETEDKLSQWIALDESRKAKYGNALTDIDSAYMVIDKYTVQKYYYYEAIKYGPEILNASASYKSLMAQLKNRKVDQGEIAKITTSLKKKADAFFKDYNLPTDKKLFSKMMQMYHQNVLEDQQPKYLIEASIDYELDYDKMADKVFSNTMFCDKDKLAKFLDNPSAKVLANDPAYIVMKAFSDNFDKFKKESEKASEQLAKGNRLFIQALQLMEKDKKFYPDANFTMRLTYGKVKGYDAADAIHYKYYTTIDGLMAKEDPNNPEFIVPAKLKELYEAKDYGIYGEGNTLHVCFLSNNDITGGNSGSPVINGKGELIGLAFDGNWEAMSGDIAFEPELQRTISVDIRYVLFIIDKFAGAANLIDEMKFVGNNAKKN